MLKLENSIRGLSFSRVAFDLTIQDLKRHDMKDNKRLSFRFSTPQQVRKSLSRINNMVANGEMDSKKANTIIVGANAILGAIRLDEQQKQIEKLEELVNEFTE